MLGLVSAHRLFRDILYERRREKVQFLKSSVWDCLVLSGSDWLWVRIPSAQLTISKGEKVPGIEYAIPAGADADTARYKSMCCIALM